MPEGLPPGQPDRRGLDTGLLAVIQALHTAFVASHQREHQLHDEATTDLIAERDARYTEHFKALDQTIRALDTASREAVSAAQKAAREMTDKSAASLEKAADKTYVTLDKLSMEMSRMVSRDEFTGSTKAAEALITELRKTYDASVLDLRDRMKAQEERQIGRGQERQDRNDWQPWLALVVSIAVLVVLVVRG